MLLVPVKLDHIAGDVYRYRRLVLIIRKYTIQCYDSHSPILADRLYESLR